MSFQTLYRAKAFGPGADMWVIPEGSNSPMAKKVDWYLNFQVARAELHSVMPVSPELKKIIVENDLDLPEPKLSAGAPLMIASSQHFPTSQIIEIKVQSSLNDWVSRIQNIWLKLRRPRMRVFLPNDLTPEDFEKIWQSNTKAILQPNEEISLVPR